MFKALYVKEWKEKTLLFFFEMGILILLFAGQLIFKEKKDIREWLIYAVLLLFYPFAALVLGAAGFEAEYRQGAWAYLFSRPVGRGKVWLAKFTALASMLAALWFVFVAMWFALPGLREFVGGTRLLLGFSVGNGFSGFPWWSLGQSVFLLVIAFSLSPLHERQFNILFLALVGGFLFPVAAWALLTTKAGGFLAWIAPWKGLPIFVVSQVLVALAFAAASILTLVKSDFSQSRKQILGFVRRFTPFLVLALAGTAAWALLMPAPSEHYLAFLYSSGGEPYYATGRGVFKYSAAGHRIRWLARSRQTNFFGYFTASAAGGKIFYTFFDIKSKNDIFEELWMENADGSGRKRIIGRGTEESGWPPDAPIRALLPSPDGTRIAILSGYHDGKRPPLWTVNADGTQLENLPRDSALSGTRPGRYSLDLTAWALDGKGLLLTRRSIAKPVTFSLWLYDLGSRTARIVLDNAVPASWLSPVSPRGDLLAVKYEKSPEALWTLGLLDLKTLWTTDIVGPTGEPVRALPHVSWDNGQSKMAYVTPEAQAGGPDVYALAVFSLAAGKTVAEKVMAKAESTALKSWPCWTADGSELLVLDQETSGLRVFDQELHEVGRIALPEWMTTPVGLHVVGDQALIEEDKTDTLWSCNLIKKTWKRVY
jgi:hypothetical protein